MGFLESLLPRFDSGASSRFQNSLENPRVSLNDPRAWDELFGINLSDTGVRVTPQIAIGYSPLWRGINLICNTVMKLPLYPYKTIKGGQAEIDTLHPAYRVVQWQVNEYLTAGLWKQVMVFHALFRGNGYSGILRNGRGDVAELLPLSPTDTHPVIEDGRLWYASKIGKEKRKIPAEDVFHLKGLSYDGLVGYDVLTVMKDELGVGIGSRKYASKFFANGASTGGVLMIPRGMSEKAAKQLRKDWKDYQEGMDNSFRTAVLEDGAKWIPTTFNPQMSQMLESRQFSIIEVSNVLGIPPHKLGDNTRQAYNSIEAENDTLLDDTYDPWLFRIEEEADCKFLSGAQQDRATHFFCFDRRSIRRPDQKTVAEIRSQEVNGGLCTVNEDRARHNEPPLPSEIGDVLRIPSTVVLVDPETGKRLDAPEPQPAPGGAGAPPAKPAAARNAALDAAHRSLFEDRLDRFGAIAAGDLGKGKPIDQRAKVAEACRPIFAAIFAVNEGGDVAGASAAFAAAWNEWTQELSEGCLQEAATDREAAATLFREKYPGLRDGLLDQIFKESQES